MRNADHLFVETIAFEVSIIQGGDERVASLGIVQISDAVGARAKGDSRGKTGGGIVIAVPVIEAVVGVAAKVETTCCEPLLS